MERHTAKLTSEPEEKSLEKRTLRIPAINIQSSQREKSNGMEGQKQNSQGHAKVSRPYKQDRWIDTSLFIFQKLYMIL